MPARVVDASALAALIHAEPGAAGVAASLTDAPLIAPALLPHELDSVCARKIRANPRDRLRLLAARALADELGIALVEVDHRGVIELALETGLTTYDAAYLWLTAAHAAELVTLDARLARAAARTRT
jgi:predicted nucleic acid-binding protein